MKVKPGDTFLPEFGPDNPDPRPGFYYVTVLDGQNWLPLTGPYVSHARALRHVAPVREIAQRHDVKAAFYGFGTIRVAEPIGIGVLHKTAWAGILTATEHAICAEETMPESAWTSNQAAVNWYEEVHSQGAA